MDDLGGKPTYFLKHPYSPVVFKQEVVDNDHSMMPGLLKSKEGGGSNRKPGKLSSV